jgi:thiamine biosynthesis lipoprotein
MATRFEVVLHGDDPVRLRAAGEEALAEIQRLDRQLSFYRPDSELSWVNAHAGQAPVPIEPRFFRLLERCLQLSDASDGAFDITVAPLMRAWRFVNARGAQPDRRILDVARDAVGRHCVALDTARRTVRFTHPRVAIDLGAAGKGYAIDCAMNVLAEHGIGNAFLHGGTSSAHAVGNDEGEVGWRVGWAPPDAPVERILLRDAALSVSAPHGKCFEAEGRTFGHVMDPRTGEPVVGAASALVVGPRSFECDALSTALLVLGIEWLPTLTTRFPGYRAKVA